MDELDPYIDRIPPELIETVDRVRAKVDARRVDAEAKRSSGKWLTEFGAVEDGDCSRAFAQGMVWSAGTRLPLLVGPGIWGAYRTLIARPGATVLCDPAALIEKRFDETMLWGGVAPGFLLVGGLHGARDEANRRQGNIFRVLGDDVAIVDAKAQWIKGLSATLRGRDTYASISSTGQYHEGAGGIRVEYGPFLVENCDVDSSDDCLQCWCYEGAAEPLIGAFLSSTARPQQGAAMAAYNLHPEFTAKVLFAGIHGVMVRDVARVRQRVTAVKLIAEGGGDVEAYLADCHIDMRNDTSDNEAISIVPSNGNVRAHLIDVMVHRQLAQAIKVEALRDQEIMGRAFITIDGGLYTRPRMAGVPTISRRQRDVLAMTGRPVVKGRVEVR